MDNEARFKEFYEMTREALYGYLFRTLGEAAASQDLMQEAYLRLLSADTGRLDDRAMRAYLFKIATNLLRDRFRKLRVEKAWSDEVAGADQAVFVSSDQSGTAVAALERLTPQNRSLLWLAYVEEYDHKEIGRMLGLSPRSVRVLLFRARKKMVEFLGGNRKGKVTLS